MADDDVDFSTPYSLMNAYQNQGLQGWIDDPRSRNEFFESQKYQYFKEPNIAGIGKGKRSLLWGYLKKLDPTAFEERQRTGDCVAHGSRNARDMARAAGIIARKERYGWYERGALERTYGARGHGGQGMSPGVASKFERDVGFLPRDKFDYVDLSAYNPDVAIRWGRSGVPREVQSACNTHKVGVISIVRSQDDLMDAMINGYGAHSGQYAAWDASPNKQHYYNRISPGWNHDMAIGGYDDTKSFWPFRVWFLMQEWGQWNQKPKEWPKDYPPWVPGMIVVKDDDFQVCIDGQDCWLYGSVDGYPPQSLPDYGAIGLLSTDE